MRIRHLSRLAAIASLSMAPVLAEAGVAPFAQTNLFKDGSRMHFIPNELNVIAPGQLIFFVKVEEKRAAFLKHMWKNPSPEMDCPQDMKGLHGKLTSTPEFLLAMVRDAHAIMYVGEGI